MTDLVALENPKDVLEPQTAKSHTPKTQLMKCVGKFSTLAFQMKMTEIQQSMNLLLGLVLVRVLPRVEVAGASKLFQDNSAVQRLRNMFDLQELAQSLQLQRNQAPLLRLKRLTLLMSPKQPTLLIAPHSETEPSSQSGTARSILNLSSEL